MVITNTNSVSQGFLLFVSATIALTLYPTIDRIPNFKNTRRKTDIHRANPQNTIRLDIPPPHLNIPPPLHGKNLFLIHIGPDKTGTTSIQNTMASLDATGILPKDNFYYLGKRNTELPDVLFPTDRDLITPLLEKGSKSWFNPKRNIYTKIRNDFKQRFHEFHASQNHNVFASAEELAVGVNLSNTTFFEALKQMIPVDQYDIHFVMMYRRYIERLLSLYHFNNTPRWFELGRWNSWPCLIFNPYDPCAKSRIYKTFREFYHEMIHPYPSIWDFYPNQITSLSLYRAFQYASPKTWSFNVVNMHHPGSSSDVVVDLLCGMGNVTANTCNYLQDMNSAEALRNLTHANVDHLKTKEDKYLIEYHLMAQYAHSIGSVHKNITRQQAELAFQGMFRKWKGGRQVQVYKEGDTIVSSWNGDQDMTIPLACLSREEHNDILTESENIESNLVPAFYNSIYGKDSLRQQFRKIEADHAFCNIALGALFQNDTYWVDFLDCLHKSALIQECL